MKKFSLIIIFLLVLALTVTVLVACNEENQDPADTSAPGTSAATESVGSADTEAATIAQGTSTDTPDVTRAPDEATGESPVESGETPTDPVTDAETEPETDPVGMRLNDERLVKQFNSANQVNVTAVEDPTEGLVMKLATTSASADPFVAFNYSNATKVTKTDAVNLSDHPFMILKVRCEGCTSSTFELYWTCSTISGFTGDARASAPYDNTDDGWQYIIFDMSQHRHWTGKLTGLRFDYQLSAAGADEAMYIAAIWFAGERGELLNLMGDMEDPFAYETDPVLEAKVDALLSVKDPAPANDNRKLDAADEDKGIDLWFNHSYTKTPAEDTTSTGWNSYTMRLAKNEIEDCHMLLASADGRTGLTVSVTDFTNKDGVSLTTDLMYAYYFDDVEGLTIPDPTPWVREGKTFDLAAGKSQIFVIKVHTAQDSPAGLYEATVTVRNAEGKEVKKAVVYAYVWNFVLPEATSCKTQMDLSWFNIYAAHKCYEGDDGLLYKNYYDYLLENRICAYNLPYYTNDNTGRFTDERVLPYLNNPRVVAFNAINWKNHQWNETVVANAYAFLSQKQEWLDKAYFYIVDEPGTQAALDEINRIGAILKENFPGYKMMSPEHVNYALNAESTEDYFTAVRDSINVWCYKPYFYTTYEQYRYSTIAFDEPLTYWMTPQLEKNLGSFADRIKAEQDEGDELWWYVTRKPESPEITLLMETQAVRYRILFWQQKLYHVDSFLYYLVNDWYEIGENAGLNKKHEVSDFPYDVYGNGVLVYCGAPFDEYGPVGSLRLECVRDGIEDFEYLTMLTQKYDTETVDAIIRRLTTSIAHYNTDEEFFTALRISVGNLLEQAENQ